MTSHMTDWRLETLHRYERYEKRVLDALPELEKLDQGFNSLRRGLSFKAAANSAGVSAMRLRTRYGTDFPDHPRHATLSQDRRKKIQAMLDDGCSFTEIAATLHVQKDTLRKYWPGRGWTQSQAGSHGVTMTRLGKVLK